MMYPCFCNLSLRDICSCACELECKYRSRFGGIILPSLVLEGKLLDALFCLRVIEFWRFSRQLLIRVLGSKLPMHKIAIFSGILENEWPE